MDFLLCREDQESFSSRNVTASVGTTAEIFSVKEEEEYGIANMVIKAEGRQRFKVIDIKRQTDGYICLFEFIPLNSNCRNFALVCSNGYFEVKQLKGPFS